MTSKIKRDHGAPRIEVELGPDRVFSGGSVRLRVAAACGRGCDLAGHAVVVRAADGAEVAHGVLAPTEAEDGSGAATWLVVPAPDAVGAATYTVAVPEHEDTEAALRHAEGTAELAFDVEAHAARAVAWRTPPAVAPGERFGVHVGISCAAGCSFAGSPFEVRDVEGALVASGRVGDDVWPGSDHVYAAEIAVPAPGALGAHRWTVAFAVAHDARGHGPTEQGFGTRVAPPADCEVAVTAIDHATQAPIAGAIVTMHPFRGATGPDGVARLAVARGTYQLFVSGFEYVAQRHAVTIDGPYEHHVELVTEPEPDPYAQYQ